MALPKISHPTFNVTLPSSGQIVKVRPMLVKDEKVLLLAKEAANVDPSTESQQILVAVKQIVNNCLVPDQMDVDRLPTFDIEFLFTQIRSLSVDNKVKVSYRDEDDNKSYEVEVDLDKVTVKKPDKENFVVDLGDGKGLKLKYPDGSIYENKSFAKGNADEVFHTLVINAIESYFDGDEYTVLKLQPKKDVEEFVDNLDVNTFNKVKEFFLSMPSLYYEVKYTNSLGTEKTITLRSIFDFFTF